jgi:hypothetical protein
MNLRIGDIVRFLNDTGGGKITRVDQKGLFFVMTEDGFEIPVRANELLLVSSGENKQDTRIHGENSEALHPKEYQSSGKSDGVTVTAELPAEIPPGASVKVLIGLVPDDPEAIFKNSIQCFLINDSKYFLYYRIGYQQQGKYFYLNSGSVEPDTKCFIADFNQVQLGKITLFHIQALPVSRGCYYKIPVVDEEISIAHYDFSKSHIYKINDYFDEDALIPGVTLVDIAAQMEGHRKDVPEKKLQQNVQVKSTDSMEVDLHIEALHDDYAHLSNSEILRIQMNRFRSALEDAISDKLKRIVFIHGVGNGTLKLELRNELKRNYPEFTYQDASFKEYGFGATMVHLR